MSVSIPAVAARQRTMACAVAWGEQFGLASQNRVQ
jgi:hypothetical protein